MIKLLTRERDKAPIRTAMNRSSLEPESSVPAIMDQGPSGKSLIRGNIGVRALQGERS